MTTPPVWGIHGGKTGDAFTLFTQEKKLGLGWPAISDLSTIPNDQNAFREAVIAAFPGSKLAAAAVNGGQLRRFAHELQKGDIVVFPPKTEWTYWIGRVAGPYHPDPELSPAYPHQRPVEWIKTIPRDAVSPAARLEMGAAMSFFRVRRHAAEFLAQIGISGAPSELPPTEGGEESGEPPNVLSAGQIEEVTREFVLEKLRTLYAGHALESFVGDLLHAMGYESRVTQKSGDHGIDVVAGRGPLGLDPPILKVQVKSGQGSTGEPDLLKLNGALDTSHGERGVVVSLGGFSPPAVKWAQGKEWFQLIGPGDLVDLALEHYDRLSLEHRESIPLRLVLAPDVAGGTAS